MNLEELLKFAVAQGASDIHLQAGSTPQLRLGGLIRNVEGATVDAISLRQFVASIAPTMIAESLDAALVRGARFAKSFESLARFRCSLYSHRGLPGIVLRVLPATVPTFDQLKLPPVVREIGQARRGITLITGPSGSGKSTTLTALVDQLNESLLGKIVTIEDPIEILHPHKRALVSQREIGTDVTTMAAGIEQAIDQDADVIVAGELRDADALRAALRAGETGHQVLALTTSPNCSQAVERLIGLVPAEEKRHVTTLLAEGLVGLIAQKLATTKDGKRQPVVEILRGGQYTSRCILENRWNDLTSSIGSRQGGMQQLEQHLLELYQAGTISGTEAMKLATNPEVVAEGLRTMKRPTAS